jgi:hypothetical protein
VDIVDAAAARRGFTESQISALVSACVASGSAARRAVADRPAAAGREECGVLAEAPGAAEVAGRVPGRAPPEESPLSACAAAVPPKTAAPMPTLSAPAPSHADIRTSRDGLPAIRFPSIVDSPLLSTTAVSRQPARSVIARYPRRDG